MLHSGKENESCSLWLSVSLLDHCRLQKRQEGQITVGHVPTHFKGPLYIFFVCLSKGRGTLKQELFVPYLNHCRLSASFGKGRF